jgi:hypothetical protein
MVLEVKAVVKKIDLDGFKRILRDVILVIIVEEKDET